MVYMIVARSDYNSGSYKLAEGRRKLACGWTSCGFILGTAIWAVGTYIALLVFGYINITAYPDTDEIDAFVL